MTTLKLGWTNPLTDVFGAHPTFGAVLDLNDGTNFSLVSPDGLELPPPPRTLVAAGNIRTQGERVTRAIYRHNRKAVARLILGPASSGSALTATIRGLLDWLGGPPNIPITLQYQPFNGTAPIYLDVVGCAHEIPADEEQWLRLQMESLEIVFLARPGLRGDRITLDNLVTNPGFEAPSGPGVSVFNDSFATTNAYAVLAGSNPTLAANLMTIPVNTRVAFGSPSWGAINTWQVRLQWITGTVGTFHLHFTDANNTLSVQVATGGGNFLLRHRIAGVNNTLASASPTLTTGNFYWLQVTQFPSVAGDPSYIQATLFNDSAGAIGSQVAQIAAPTTDAITALSGRPQIVATGAALAIGGAFSNVHTVSLFGPGGWTFQPITSGGGTTGVCSRAWESSTANTYPNGPVTSFMAGRIDLAPAGTVDSSWRLYTGGAPLGTFAMPASAGDTVQAACVVKSSGLHANALLRLYVYEWDASGAFLRNTVLQTLSGNQAGWTPLAGSVVLGASTTYVDLALRVIDTTNPGESANGIVWFDNAQL